MEHLTLNTLRLEDIEQKVRLNEQSGVDIYMLRREIEKEMNDWRWQIIRATVQCQCYEEQIRHIDRMIKERELQPVR